MEDPNPNPNANPNPNPNPNPDPNPDQVQGKLKLIDFGIAKEKDSNTTNINRDATVGTLNYMSPEAITDAGTGEASSLHKLGRASDVW